MSMKVNLSQNADQFKDLFTKARSSSSQLYFRITIGDSDLNSDLWADFIDKCCTISSDESKICDSIINCIENFIRYPVDDVTDTSEMTDKVIIDALLSILCMGLNRTRDRKTSISTSGNCRPIIR